MTGQENSYDYLGPQRPPTSNIEAGDGALASGAMVSQDPGESKWSLPTPIWTEIRRPFRKPS
jgi:hypothetical protein